MKYLGIDYGSKRIGVAVSDESAVMAFPLGVVEAGPGALQEILDIIKENGVKIAVMGESLNFQQKKNAIMQKVESFAEKLQAHNVAVEFEQEFLTSAFAGRQFDPFDEKRTNKPRARQTKASPRENHDASAAALILQSYLDRLRKSQ